MAPGAGRGVLLTSRIGGERSEAQSFVDRFGVVNLNKLKRSSVPFQQAEELGELRRFFHWELEFADLFRDNWRLRPDVGEPSLAEGDMG